MADSGEIPPRRKGIGCSVKSFSFDGSRAIVDARGDMDFEAGPLCSAGHRQAIQQEGPILVDDIEQSSRWFGVRGCHSLKFPEIGLIARSGLRRNAIKQN